MLDKFSKYVPAISLLTVAAPASQGRSATSREVAGRKRYLRVSCGWLVVVAVLAISPIAHADPVHMACSRGMLLPNSKVDTNSVLSLTIDLRAGAVTVGDTNRWESSQYSQQRQSPGFRIRKTTRCPSLGRRSRGY